MKSANPHGGLNTNSLLNSGKNNEMSKIGIVK